MIKRKGRTRAIKLSQYQYILYIVWNMVFQVRSVNLILNIYLKTVQGGILRCLVYKESGCCCLHALFVILRCVNQVVVVLGNFKHARLGSVLWRWSSTGQVRWVGPVEIPVQGGSGGELDAMNIHKLRSCIRREFVTEAMTEKLLIEGITFMNAVWELVKLNRSIA